MTYTLTVTDKQALVIMDAVELLARVHMGQMESVVSEVASPTQAADARDCADALKLAIYPELSPTAYYGIVSPELRKEARIAWDIFQVVRQRLALDALEPGERPNRMLVIYDDPLHASKEPLARMEETA